MIDLNGKTITNTAGALAFGGINFNTNGVANAATQQPGYCGYKNVGDYYQSVANTAWPITSTVWDSGHLSSGVFTCPAAGIYLCSAAGIMNGFGATSTHGYAGWSKNNVNTVYMHWNVSTLNGWVCGGTAQLFLCAAGDTLRFHVNNAPLVNFNAGSAYGAVANPGYGWYNQAHHSIWITRVS